MLNETRNHQNYFERNSRWLYPLIASCLLLASLSLLERVGIAPPINPVLIIIGALVGIALTGFFAYQTDTTSAKIICYVAIIGGLALGVITLFSDLKLIN